MKNESQRLNSLSCFRKLFFRPVAEAMQKQARNNTTMASHSGTLYLLNVFINELEREMNGEVTKSLSDIRVVKTQSDCKDVQ